MSANPRHVLANGLRAGETRYGTFMMEATTVHARSVAMCGWDVSRVLGLVHCRVVACNHDDE